VFVEAGFCFERLCARMIVLGSCVIVCCEGVSFPVFVLCVCLF